MQSLPLALAPLGRLRQFILYRLEPHPTKPGKTAKYPCDPSTGWKHDAHDPAIWAGAEEAIAAAARFGPSYGIGFVFTDNDPYFFIDIDDCLLPNGQWSEVANQLCTVFAGCAIGRSQSGRGLHIFGAAYVPPHAKKNIAHHLEFYHRKRFVALADSDGEVGSADHMPDPRAVQWLIDSYFPDDGSPDDPEPGPGRLTDAPRADWNGPRDDDDLIRRACNAKSANAAFNGGITFNDLWLGDVDEMTRKLAAQGKPYDASGADASLSMSLAFWTGCHGTRMLDLMRRSGLVRDKWEREDYLPLTIATACAKQTSVCQDKAPVPPPPAPVGVPAPPDANAALGPPAPSPDTFGYFVNREHAQAFFAGCAYVSDLDKVRVPDGRCLSRSPFNNWCGDHVFQHATESSWVKEGWKYFLASSKAWGQTVHRLGYFPGEPTGQITTDLDDVRLVNTYRPTSEPMALGDVSPWLDLLQRMWPQDWKLVDNWLKSERQHPGNQKWCPFLQGVPGCGKSTVLNVLARMVGEHNVNRVRPADIKSQFTGALDCAHLMIMEEGEQSASSHQIVQMMKSLITDRNVVVESKGVDRRSAKSRLSVIVAANDKGAMPKDRNDRRIAPLFAAQQRAEDLIRDGMERDGPYFHQLNEWLDKQGGFEAVHYYYATTPIEPEYDPLIHRNAPATSSTLEAIDHGLDTRQQYIMDCIELGQEGFCGGFVSGRYVQRMFEGPKRTSISQRAIKHLLEGMGYIRHPALKLTGGRTANVVEPDFDYTYLYVRADDKELLGIVKETDVCRAYAASQKSKARVVPMDTRSQVIAFVPPPPRTS